MASSKDQGRSFSTPVQVSKEKLNLDWGPDARPQIVVEKTAASRWRFRSSGTRRSTARCSPQGRAMAAKLCRVAADHVDNESQRFVALGLDADGSVFAAWIDKRNRVPAQQEGRKYEGQGCSSRHRRTAALFMPRRGWRPTTPASAAGSVWRSPAPAVPWWCSGTSSKAACGITRS